MKAEGLRHTDRRLSCDVTQLLVRFVRLVATVDMRGSLRLVIVSSPKLPPPVVPFQNDATA